MQAPFLSVSPGCPYGEECGNETEHYDDQRRRFFE